MKKIANWFKRFFIPKGTYCYTPIEAPSVKNGFKYKIKKCPFWSSNPDKDKQENGYCSYLKYGDWESEGVSLLWDQIKSCNVNEGDE